jgi:hypothetical protein
MQGVEDINERVDWIEEEITKNYIKYYDFNNFNNIKKIGTGTLGEVQCANWKNSKKCVALKTFFKFDDVTIKEIAQEVVKVFGNL